MQPRRVYRWIARGAFARFQGFERELPTLASHCIVAAAAAAVDRREASSRSPDHFVLEGMHAHLLDSHGNSNGSGDDVLCYAMLHHTSSASFHTCLLAGENR
jgi:hypothetical protein